VVPVFDGYRAYAILGIVLLHVLFSSGVTERAGESLGGQLISGTLYHAVDVLFIVSGFVVFLPTVARAGEFGSIGGYAIRRAARLFPPLWLCLAIVLAVIAWADRPIPGAGEIAVNFGGQGALAQLFDEGLRTGLGANGALWTLTPEIGFYIVLPFVAVAFFRRPLVGLAIAAAVAILWREAFDNLVDIADAFGFSLSDEERFRLSLHQNQQLPYWAFSFAAGMSAAVAYVRARERGAQERLRRLSPALVGGALAALLVFVYLAGRYAADENFLLAPVDARQTPLIAFGYTGSLAALMLALAFAGPALQRPFAHPLVRRLADVSYGIFLIHVVIIWWLEAKFPHSEDGSFADFARLAVIVFPGALLYGYVTARFFEQPIRRWAHRYGRRAQAERTLSPTPAPPVAEEP
jgi:peptidoglycan/LPS O-acetylase OafA/YrhL